MSAREQRLTLGLAVLAIVLGVAALTLGLGALLGDGVTELVVLAPLLALALPLLLGRYVGEDLIAQLAARPRRATRRSAVGAVDPNPSAPLVLLARGGALLAARLAVRPPPARAVLQP